MAKDRFLIAPINSGWVNNRPPFMIPDNAFYEINNAYVWRGQVKKRFGGRLLRGSATPSEGFEHLYSRLRMNLGTLVGSPSAALPLPVAGAQMAEGQMFSIGENIFTIYQLGLNVAVYTTNVAITATIDSTAGTQTITVTGAAGLDVYWYPSLPVMGISQRETQNVNDEITVAWDTRFSYEYNGLGWEYIALGGAAALWSGTDTDFFWSNNHRGSNSSTSDKGLFFTTNNVDNIKVLRAGTWAVYDPETFSGSTVKIETCRIIVSFKNRLLFLNTLEGAIRFQGRCRYSTHGAINNPPTTDFYQEPEAKYGGFVDNTETTEAIITAQFIRDRLIVFFERSTWELVYTWNEVTPFAWQRINTEIGAEATFSQVPFDTKIFGIGNNGIVECSGTSVKRIDNNIPDEVFKIHNDDDGPERVAGIRDYVQEMTYWTYVSDNQGETQVYPNRVFTYNYENGAWARNDDTITAFGYIQDTTALTWGAWNTTWGESDFLWGDGTFAAKTNEVLAGNHRGFTFIVDSNSTRNTPSVYIQDIVIGAPFGDGNFVNITAPSHNLADNDFILLESIQGMTGLNENIYQVGVTDVDTIFIAVQDPVGTYTGGGTYALVSRMNMLSKQYNFYLSKNMGCDVESINFLVQKTAAGEFSVDYYTSSSDFSIVNGSGGSLSGTGTVKTSPYALARGEANQDRLWHEIYTWLEGECVQFRIYLTDEQVENRDKALAPFTLYAIMISADPADPISF